MSMIACRCLCCQKNNAQWERILPLHALQHKELRERAEKAEAEKERFLDPDEYLPRLAEMRTRAEHAEQEIAALRAEVDPTYTITDEGRKMLAEGRK